MCGRSELLTLLKTYNCYHEGRSFQLRHREEEGALVIEGLLNIAWGLKRPIRLQIQDDREPVHLSSASWVPGQSSCHLNEPPLQDGRVPAQRPSIQPSEHRAESSRDSSEPLEEDKEIPQLMRTKSDAACVIQRRPRCRTPGETQRIRRHRFSINGHFYNHKAPVFPEPQLACCSTFLSTILLTVPRPGVISALCPLWSCLELSPFPVQTSVFTPAYGSVTNVRVNSTMTTLQVLTLLLNKFRVENSPSEFALYIVHESGERTKLKDCEYPLISRILHGPCEKIARIFLMEADLGEEVPHDVAQYIKFEMPVLDSFVEKLKEEEQREIIKLTMKFQALRLTMLQRLEQLVEAK
ncbi:ras association domain-containing protein 4 isoform X2 [Pteronotus mesoamericanus]|uniref:ras association domain-containing protein 4 isoform X2 n=1 Tax=Pteronotus mesoamericanus TaxID=1884717 RepID=UPI0023ED9204|nr:ras association domain-containing protein 4 isoform X2 [Pteronotus parnellii mesoamericanus]